MEAVGAAAAVAQLLSLCTKCTKAAAHVAQSYRDAPRELEDLSCKTALLQSRMRLLDMNGDTSAYVDEIFPSVHRQHLLGLLSSQYAALTDIADAANSSKQLGRSKRARWAAIDRLKVRRVMDKVTEVNDNLDRMILAATFQWLGAQRASLDAMQAYQSLLLPAVESATREIISSIQDSHTELCSLVSGSRQRLLTQATNGETERHLLASQNIRRNRPLQSEIAARKGASCVPQRILDMEDYEARPKSSARLFGRAKEREGNYYAAVSTQSSKDARAVRLQLRARLRLLRQHVVTFEIAFRVSFGYLPRPEWGHAIHVVNVRPYISDVFRACQSFDLARVRALLECGEASIYDVDDWHHGGLLEHAVDGLREREKQCGEAEHAALEKLVQYLLVRGCRSWAYKAWPDKHQTGYRLMNGPALLSAMTSSATDLVRLMLQNGLTFDSIGSEFNPARHLSGRTQSDLYDQISLLRSQGFEDWNGHSEGLNQCSILHSAVQLGNIHDTVYALDVLKININDDDGVESPMELAALTNNVAMAAVIESYGAPSTSMAVGCAANNLSYDMFHWLLSSTGRRPQVRPSFEHQLPCARGASEPGSPSDPAPPSRVTTETSESLDFQSPLCVWEAFWKLASRRSGAWHFQRMTLLLQHILSHAADPFEAFETTRSLGYVTQWCAVPRIRALELAKMWSYTYDTSLFYNNDGDVDEATKALEVAFEDADRTGVPVAGIQWRDDGYITKFDPLEMDDDSQEDGNDDASTSTDSMYSTDEAAEDSELENSSIEVDAVFRSIVESEVGRRHLKRYPMVKALCCALQLSGFSADMDDDGDIWFDDGDGYPYYDCLETMPGDTPHDSDRSLPCVICLEPSKYGGQHIVEAAENGLRQAEDARRQLKTRKSMPSR